MRDFLRRDLVPGDTVVTTAHGFQDSIVLKILRFTKKRIVLELPQYSNVERGDPILKFPSQVCKVVLKE